MSTPRLRAFVPRLLGWPGALALSSMALSTLSCQQILGIPDPLLVDGSGATGGRGGAGANAGSGGTQQGGSGGGASGNGGSAGGVHDVGPFTGIWYSPAYANKGHYQWTLAYPPPGGFFGPCDFDGDGKTDGLIRNQTTWTVLLSDGTSLSKQYGLLSYGSDTDTPLLGDINGDRKCDVMLFTQNTGTWVGAESAGTNLMGAFQFITGFGTAADNAFLADVDCDGRADAVAFYRSTGVWQVALSKSSPDRFVYAGPWNTGFGANSDAQLMGDVDGDGCADAVAFTKSTGQWQVAKSTGTAFGTGTVWLTGFGTTATRVLLGDVSGDGNADAIAFHGTTGTWETALSTGTKFGTPSVVAEAHGVGAGTLALAKMDGGNTDELVAVWPDGTWRVLPGSYKRPAAYNTWEALDIRYSPLDSSGKPAKYDGADGSVISAQLKAINDAKIDFALLDLTNYPVTNKEYDRSNALVVCAAIANAVRVQQATPLFAVAVGAVQQTHDPQTIEDEANAVWADFADSALCGKGTGYFELDGKPLLVIAAPYSDRQKWEAWTGDKSAAAKFTIRWAQSEVPGSGLDQVPPGNYGDYYGFAYPSGPLEDPETMVVSPGFNHGGIFVSRTASGVAGGTYENAWNSTQSASTRVVIIESYNDYVNQTAVAPTDTTALVAPSEPWLDASSSPAPNLYWNATVAHNAVRKK